MHVSLFQFNILPAVFISSARHRFVSLQAAVTSSAVSLDKHLSSTLSREERKAGERGYNNIYVVIRSPMGAPEHEVNNSNLDRITGRFASHSAVSQEFVATFEFVYVLLI